MSTRTIIEGVGHASGDVEMPLRTAASIKRNLPSTDTKRNEAGGTFYTGRLATVNDLHPEDFYSVSAFLAMQAL